jgi:very-short-patch-repair endonuclease
MKKDKSLTGLARKLRARPTDAEAALWSKICNRQLAGAKFRRQQKIENYIVDFVCFEGKLVIEIDGGQYNETSFMEKDTQRTSRLEQKGYRVLRYWNNDVLQNIDGVVYNILEVLNK